MQKLQPQQQTAEFERCKFCKGFFFKPVTENHSDTDCLRRRGMLVGGQKLD